MRSTFAKIKEWLKKAARVLLNPRLVLCFVLAWMITNGWCYLAILIGTWANISWLALVGSAYAGFLWLPFTPEKIATVFLSIALLRLLFPKDEKTLKFLKDKLAQLRSGLKQKRANKNRTPRTEAE